MSALVLIGGMAVLCGVAGVWVALFYVRGALRAQHEARVLLTQAWKDYAELTRRLYGQVSLDHLPPPPSSGRVSLKCLVYGDRPHWPCSGTTDDGTEAACGCWCHQVPAADLSGMVQ